MFRRSVALHRVSPFSLYQKHLGKSGVLKGLANPNLKSSRMYHQLTSPEKRILEKRALRLSYPALDAYNRLQKQCAHQFQHLPLKQRQRKVAQLWAELKEKKNAAKLRKTPTAAKRKIATAAKTAKTKRTSPKRRSRSVAASKSTRKAASGRRVKRGAAKKAKK
ncbi:kinetoplast-associated protein 3 [Novymonas esmeraldas]|uniref:Kinetoplast-associated protein 3 n=1 Tax=Novymonas esmeraldas TaxID=1808958 RepID=A0AAW0EYX0_9TRYP